MLRTLLTLLVFALCPACFDIGMEPWNPGFAPDAALVKTSTAPVDMPMMTCPHADGKPAVVTVSMNNNKYHPPIIHICAGDTVVWRNIDSKEHTVYTGTPESPTGMIASQKLYFNDEFQHTFEVASDYIYYCTTHKKKMRDAMVFVR